MLNKLFLTVFTLLLSSTLFSNDALTNYRLNGINEIEKKMDLGLTDESYWKEYLVNIDTSFGYIESYRNILACDKSNSSLTLYTRDSNNSYKITKEYAAYTGEKEGDKATEGDLKTPIGIYALVKKISKLDSFYGPMAFVTSYPNTYDKYRNKEGHGIWIHGLPTEQERDEFTKGCIAINNQDIKCLNNNIDINKTILIIANNSISNNISKDKLSFLLSSLYKWRYAWLYSDIDSYLDFYSQDFKRFDGMNLQNFVNYKTRIFSKNEKKTIIFNEINIIPYPNTEDIYKITFIETYHSNNFSFIGKKVLIIKLANKKMEIITEK